jgi:hypothetical protein
VCPRDTARDTFDAFERDDARFDRGLQRLLNGIELELRQRGAISGPNEETPPA